MNMKKGQVWLAKKNHDVKSLLASVKAYGQLLQRKIKKNGDIKDLGYLIKIDTQVDKITKLITDIFDTIKKDKT